MGKLTPTGIAPWRRLGPTLWHRPFGPARSGRSFVRVQPCPDAPGLFEAMGWEPGKAEGEVIGTASVDVGAVADAADGWLRQRGYRLLPGGERPTVIAALEGLGVADAQ